MYLKKCIKERMSSYLANTENMYEEVKQKKKWLQESSLHKILIENSYIKE